MVRFACILSIILMLAGRFGWSQDDSPIIATVGPDGALVRGGPDDVHYATSRLAAGTELEIYRLDPGRWCAVRPPDDSFSLVRGSVVELIDEVAGIGEIVVDSERCWVGTTLGEVDEPMWQVKLSRGERVRVLGSIPSASDPAEVDWYQVAPPNGEFRWIHWSELDESSRSALAEHFKQQDGAIAEAIPKTILQRDEPVAPSSVLTSTQIESLDQPVEIALTGFEPQEERREPAKPDRSEGQWRTPQKRRALTNPNPQVAQAQYAASPFIVPNSTEIQERQWSSQGTAQVALNGPSFWPPALQQLDLRLSTEILKDPSQWRLDSIATATEQVKRTGSATEIAIADHLLNKIHQFQLLQDGSTRFSTALAAPPVQGVVAVVGQEPIPLLNLSPTGAAADGDFGTGFDAHGWLNELVRNEGMGQTTYVLQDDQGKITHLISATPGLNLHRYLKTKVGIVGQKGFHQQMKLDHVTAERIVSLDSLRR